MLSNRFGCPPSGDGGYPASPGRDAPPISFSTAPKRKWAVHGPKEKAFMRKTGTFGAFLHKTGVVMAGPTSFDSLLPGAPNISGTEIPRRRKSELQTCFRGGHRMDQLLFPLPLPFRGGVSKGEGPRPLLFVSFQGGPGEIEIPPVFSFLGGVGGHFSFQKRNVPFSPVPVEAPGHTTEKPILCVTSASFSDTVPYSFPGRQPQSPACPCRRWCRRRRRLRGPGR